MALPPLNGLPVLLLAPVLEEIVFRAGLQEALLRQPRLAAHASLLSSLLFALAHGLARSPALGCAVLGPSLLLGSLYRRRRQLGPCVLAHALMNLVWWAALPWLPDTVTVLS